MPRRSALLACALVAALAASRAAEAAGCAGACPPPALAAPEPALFHAFHLVWSDPHRDVAQLYELQRRGRGEAEWTLVARIPADQAPHFDDRGPRGNGLEPGAWEYRLRGLHRAGSGEVDTEWTAPQAGLVRATCAESGGETSAALPRIVADDRDADGRYSGADIERALGECSTFGGCVLEMLPVTYDDVAIVISDGAAAACIPGRSACIALTFSRGLVIEGHGASTVLRSPLWTAPYPPLPVLEIWNRPDLRPQLRHLVLDGRKQEQPSRAPASAGEPSAASHAGFQIGNATGDHGLRSHGGCIHDVVVRDFFDRGLAVADVAGWNLERNSVEGIGCDDSLTPCPALAAGSPTGDVPVAGTGILVGAHSDDVLLRENRIRRATGPALAIQHGSDGAETSIRRPQAIANEIVDTGSVGILLGGAADGRFEGNRIARTHEIDATAESAVRDDTSGISCKGSVDRAVFTRNRIENSAGMAISWRCSGVGNTLAENRIAGSCREKNPKRCLPADPEQCYLQPDIGVGEGAAGSLVLADDEVTDSACAAPFGAELSKPQLELLIHGGRYEAGQLARGAVRFEAVDVILERVARFVGAPLEFGGAARGVVGPAVSVTGANPAFRADPSAQVLVCPAQRSTCSDLCRKHDAPRWCATSDPPAGKR